jgi:hypothetical protein
LGYSWNTRKAALDVEFTDPQTDGEAAFLNEARHLAPDPIDTEASDGITASSTRYCNLGEEVLGSALVGGSRTGSRAPTTGKRSSLPILPRANRAAATRQ